MKTHRFILVILAAVLGSCEFDDYEITYGTTISYFYNQEYNRNVVVGEGLALRPGIMFSGLLKNDQERSVNYVIDPTLVTDQSKTVLPPSYYTLGNSSEIVVPAGEFQGYLEITLDSVAFLSDPKSLTGEYVIPIRLTGSGDVDSINAGKDHMVISVSYWAKQHGNYYYSGKTVRKSGTDVVDTLAYQYNTALNESVRELVTIGPATLKMTPDGTGGSNDPAKGKFSIFMEVPTLGGGNVIVSGDQQSNIQVSPNGNSSYDESIKTFYLNYKYNDGQYDCVATDTLEFRNRIRDIQADGRGVNEWRGF